MLTTSDFIFHFEGEDVDSKLKETFGENWQEQTASKQRICFKDDLFVSIYLKGRKPKTSEEIFKSFILGFIFLDKVGSEDGYTSKTCPVPYYLTVRSLLALSKHLKIPITTFYNEYFQAVPNDFDFLEEHLEEHFDDFAKLSLAVSLEWVGAGYGIVEKFIKNGWTYRAKFDASSIDLLSEEAQDKNVDILIPTNIFLAHLNDFEIEQF